MGTSFLSLVFLSLLLAAAPSWARTVPDNLGVCPDPEPIAQAIIMCGDDQYAADKAQQCSDKVIASWQAAAEALKPALLRQSDNQNHSETDTKADYDRTIAVLDSQIKYMQDGTTLIATYTRAMIDFPGSKDDSTSAPCFNRAFHKVQDIVTHLDDEIIRAKGIRKMAMEMRDTSGTRHAKFDNGLFDSIGGGLRSAGVGAGKSENGRSDVTGTDEDAAKRKSLAESGAGAKPARRGGGSGGGGADASTLTRAEARANTSALGSPLDPSGVFSARGSLASGPASVKAAPGGGTSDSVGAVLWKEQPGEDMKIGVDLARDKDLPAGGPAAVSAAAAPGVAVGANGFASASAPAPVSAPADSAGRELTRAAGGVPTRTLASVGAAEPARGSLVVASSELDLFRLVSTRYRATELFRRARVSDVPLNGFDPSLKR